MCVCVVLGVVFSALLLAVCCVMLLLLCCLELLWCLLWFWFGVVAFVVFVGLFLVCVAAVLLFLWLRRWCVCVVCVDRVAYRCLVCVCCCCVCV